MLPTRLCPLGRLPRPYSSTSSLALASIVPQFSPSSHPTRRAAFLAGRLGYGPPPLHPPPRPDLGLGRRIRAAGRFITMEAFILPPLYFTGLLVGLWVWKCFMMVIFQNKIIYMPALPPNARLETISDYTSKCGGLQWEERRTRASDGTNLALCVASVYSGNSTAEPSHSPPTPVYILHFHGLEKFIYSLTGFRSN